MVKRSNFLAQVLECTGSPKGEVINARAEEAARWPECEGIFDLVTARSFGPPAVTAECAVRFLKVGGVLIVSEPPNDTDRDRWKASGLGLLGLRDLGRSRHVSSYEVLVKDNPTKMEYPRASGIPKKRPLF